MCLQTILFMQENIAAMISIQCRFSIMLQDILINFNAKLSKTITIIPEKVVI